jgi:hypothetical protein
VCCAGAHSRGVSRKRSRALVSGEGIVVTEDHEHANWSERGLTARIARPGLTVTRLTVAHEQVL